MNLRMILIWDYWSRSSWHLEGQRQDLIPGLSSWCHTGRCCTDCDTKIVPRRQRGDCSVLRRPSRSFAGGKSFEAACQSVLVFIRPLEERTPQWSRPSYMSADLTLDRACELRECPVESTRCPGIETVPRKLFHREGLPKGGIPWQLIP